MTIARQRADDAPPVRRRGLHQSQIRDAAAEMFRKSGYANVGMKDIAAAVGVTAPALYRHFPNKLALLRAAIASGLNEVQEDLDSAEGDLQVTLRALAVTAATRKDLWVLLRRDIRHLPVEERAAIRERFALITEQVASTVARARPDLAPHECYWLARAVIATLAAPAQYRQTLQHRTLPDALTAVSAHLCTVYGTPVPEGIDAVLDADASPFSTTTSRREELLATAARLFAERGYQSVSMDDIGSAANMAGPSLYHHFVGKVEILTAIFRRAVDWIELDRVRALRTGGDPRGMLDMLVRDYAALAISHSELFLIFTHERVHLPAEEQQALGRAHQQFFDEWVALLRSSRPELSEGVARVLVSSAMCVVNDLSQSRRLRENADFGARIVHLARQVLDTPSL